MSITPTTGSTPKLTLVDIARLKTQALDALLSSGNSDSASDVFSALPTNASSLFEQYLGAATGSLDGNVPSAADALGGFNVPGMNVMSAINRAEVTFKAQFSELSELENRIAQQADAARDLAGANAAMPAADILTRLKDFITVYNAGVNRFAPSVARGGILEGSAEAARARFSLMRDLANPLAGAEAGVRDGLENLGLTVDQKTGLASLDEERFMAAMARDKAGNSAMLANFAQEVVATAGSLNADGHPQERQMDNLQRALDWINANRSAVEKEFGPGEAAQPTPAFAKAAAAYYAWMARQSS